MPAFSDYDLWKLRSPDDERDDHSPPPCRYCGARYNEPCLVEGTANAMTELGVLLPCEETGR